MGRHAFRRVKDLVVYRQTVGVVTDEDWDAFLEALTTGEGLASLRVLVATDGAGPDSAQRRRLKTTLGGTDPKSVVVTDNSMTRFVVSTISFIAPNIRAFKRSEIGSAYDHLGLNAEERRVADRTLQELEELVQGDAGPARRDS